MRYVLFGAVGLLLAGCASFSQSDPTIEARYAAARLDLNTVLTSLVGYATKPRCSDVIQVACSEQSLVDTGLRLSTAADAALDQTRIALDSGLTTDAGLQINLAVQSLTALQSILIAELGVAQ